MKGVMSFLEKTGFLQQKDEPAQTTGADQSVPPVTHTAPVADAAQPEVQTQLSLSLEQVYAAAGVGQSNYPAEKLLRLLDGLKAMDEATRRTAVQAIDAADDAWTIEDPVRDAASKATALSSHADALRLGLQHAEQEANALIVQIRDREAATATDIRRQIDDLQGLLQRESARSSQEQAQVSAQLDARREAVNREIAAISITVADFKRLVAQFGPAEHAQPSSGPAAS